MDLLNRTVSTAQVDPRTLIENPLNFRTHTEAQKKFMRAILDEVGWVSEVIVNQSTGRIVDGHMRVALAIEDGDEVVPVRYVELSADEETVALATFDYIGSLARIDLDNLDDVIASVTSSNQELQDGLKKFFKESEGSVAFSNSGTVDVSNAAPGTNVRVGNVVFPVKRGVFTSWLEKTRQEVGFDKTSLAKEILRRLKINVEPEKVRG